MDDVEPLWRGVPLDIAPMWRALFDDSTEGIDLRAPCPVCSVSALHRWFDLHRPEPRSFAGREWWGRGSQWQWCSNCRSYEHSSGLVPAWWRPTIEVPAEVLLHNPGPIEAARLHTDVSAPMTERARR